MPALLSSKTCTTQKDHRIGVVLQVINEHFGEITRDVAQVILNIEFCTLSALFKAISNTYTGENKLTTKQVKHALLLLWKQNCLIIEIIPELDLSEITLDNQGLEMKLKLNNNSSLLYKLNIDNILNRLRIGGFFNYVAMKCSEIGIWITEEVFFHGRLRYQTVMEEVMKKWKAQKYSEYKQQQQQESGSGGEEGEDSGRRGGVGGGSGGDGKIVTFEDFENFYLDEEEMENMKFTIKETFEKLVQHRYLIIVPPLDLKKRVIISYESNKTSKKMSALFDEVNGKSSSNINSAAAAILNKTSGTKRGRAQATAVAAAAATESKQPDELLPVELRMMMASADMGITSSSTSTGVKKGNNNDEEEEWTEPTLKKSKSNTGNANPTGGRGSGRGGAGRTGRGRGRGRGATSTTIEAENEMGTQQQPSAGGLGESIIRGEAYWMIGYDQYIREERHRACINLVSDQLENVAGEIVRIFLQQSMNTELGSNPQKSTALTLDEIYAKIKEYSQQLQQEQKQQQQQQQQISPNDTAATSTSILANMDINTLKRLLDVMRLSSLAPIMRVPGSEAQPNGPLFVVNYESVIASLRRRTILQIAQGRFGIASGRIIELLQRNKYLEQQTVSDRAILPARETRERLYRLYRDRWVNYVEFSKRGDFNPSSNYYFWYLDLPRLKSSLLQHLYKSIFNLRLRKESELMKDKDILEFEIVSKNDLNRYNDLMRKINVLDFSIQKLDAMILLMEKF